MAFVPAVRKFYTSAIVSLPARRHVEKIQKIRVPHDKSAPRWMPHIPVYARSLALLLCFLVNVARNSAFLSVYPFVPNDDFPRAATQLAPVLKNIKPFNIRLSKIGSYQSKTGATVYAVPETTVRHLHRHLQLSVFGCMLCSFMHALQANNSLSLRSLPTLSMICNARSRLCCPSTTTLC